MSSTFTNPVNASRAAKLLNKSDPRCWLPWMDYVVVQTLDFNYQIVRRFFAQVVGARIVI